MKGDFTRFTFDPAKRYTRVLKQQGRVDLDADWNEQTEIADYLDRQTRIDVIGRAGVAAHPTFTITAAPPLLTLSPARFYVEGIFVDYPGETSNLPAAPNTVDQLTLDVWERHITAIDDPEIREVALGGPDTCTRVRTEFAVRVTRNVPAGTTCPTATVPVNSTGTLTATVEPTPPSDDPCLIAPAGGYRGLENRSYRVEIHAPGALGTATFKWSRDNGSVVFAVTEFPLAFPNRVRVSRLGRDQVLGFHPGDFVEILGDNNEIGPDNPGQLRRVTSINEADRELVLDAPVVAIPLAEHPRVRRWDQPSTAITTGAGPFDLEDGIQVSFAGTGTPTDFHTGDYWVFAARAATGDIEPPPPKPLGIIHYYAKLAIITWPPAGPPVIEICIPEFPPLTEFEEGGCCCCTVTVAPKGGDFTDIQAAVNSNPAASAITVCILPGEYTLNAPVIVDRSNIVIRGCGHLTRIVTAPGVNVAFSVRRRQRVRIESLLIGVGEWAITSQCAQFTVADCRMGGGVWLGAGSRVADLLRNEIGGSERAGVLLGGVPPNGTLTEGSSGSIRILDNVITKTAEAGIASFVSPEAAQDLHMGIVEIARNRISRCGGQPKLVGFSDPVAPVTGGIALARTDDVTIHHNTIEECGNEAVPASGIGAVDCTNVEIESNRIRANGTSDPGPVRVCVDFRNRGGQTVANPYLESGASFSSRNANGALVVPQPILVPIVVGGGTLGQVGLAVSSRMDINLPAGASEVAIRAYKFPPLEGARPPLTVRFFAGATQVFTQTVADNTSVVIQPVQTGITRITLDGAAGDVVQELCLTMPGVPATSVQAGIFAYLIGRNPARSGPALAVRDNLVSTPAGQSLLALAADEDIVVLGNDLVSADGRVQPNAPGQLGISLVVGVLLFNPNQEPGRGNVLFNDNQVTSTIVRFPLAQRLTSRAWLFARSDLGIDGNRFQQGAANSRPVEAHVVAGNAGEFQTGTVRFTDNRVFDLKDEIAYLVNALSTITVANHHAHALVTPAGVNHASVANIQFV